MEELIKILPYDAFKIDKDKAIELGLTTSIVFAMIQDLCKNDNLITLEELKTKTNLMINVNGFSEVNIGRMIIKLKKLKYIDLIKLSPKELSSYLMKKDLNGLGIGSFKCPWCGGRTLIPHEHHYPIPRVLGGIETINICSTCHSEFHYLDKTGFIKLVN